MASVDDRGTDPAFFAVLHKRFGFTIDVCASEHNAKLGRYLSIEEDGLRQSWSGECVWCNPPYSEIGRWVAKAHSEAASAEGIVMLLPANRTEQGWWQDLVEPLLRSRVGGFSVEFLPGRLRFVLPGDKTIGANSRPPFGCCLLIWDVRCENWLPGRVVRDLQRDLGI